MIVRIVEVTKVNFLVNTTSLSLLVTMAICRIQLSMCSLVTPTNDLAINLSMVNAVMPVHHMHVTNADSAKDCTIKWNDCTMHNPATGLQICTIIQTV